MTKRVIFLADSISTQKAGIHYYGIQLISAIMSKFPQYEYHSVSSAQLPVDAIKQHIVPIRKSIPFHLRLRQLRSIPQKVKSLHPDIVIELAHFGPFRLPESVKRITVIHDLSAITHKQFHSKASYLVQSASLPGIIKKADLIITNSYFTRSEIEKKYSHSRSKTQVLYPAVVQHADSGFDNELATPSHTKPYFLSVGTIEPRKNFEATIRAFETIWAKYPDYHLIIAGKSGWKNASFYETLNTSPARKQITLTGYISRKELSALYAESFAFISASHFEGFGIPILEASQYAIPLIVADNSSQSEIANEHALLFPSTQEDALAKHMESLILDKTLHEQMRQKSQRLSEKLHKLRIEQLQELEI